MSQHRSLSAYLSSIKATMFAAELGEKGGYITFSNSGKRGDVKSFTISLAAFLSAFNDISHGLGKFITNQTYVEGVWRDLSEEFSDLTIKSIITVQTKPLFCTMSKLIAWANDRPVEAYEDGTIEITKDSIAKTIEKISKLIDCYAPKNEINVIDFGTVGRGSLPKPLLLLAGISGTGKTRFVREQAAVHRGGDLTNYCLVPVRPDWHEPSDLLGYISRIGQDGARYVVTDLLRFVVKAWQDAKASATATELVSKSPAEMTPYWLCLDEMNLAPVEQYFADYLAVLETRKWEGGNYQCSPLLKAAVIQQLDEAGKAELRKQLELGAKHDDLWQYFTTIGIPLPPNLIVAGTVNMDETTHGFSRKVIDRAFTIDFGAFYPNDFGEFFEPVTRPVSLGFPVLSGVTRNDLAAAPADADGSKSVAFLGAVNGVLKATPFELAYRALNELLLAVVCFQPKGDAELQAVWDDFLMSKVLPRIDGDAEKLGFNDEISLLTRLLGEIEKQFTHIGSAQRPDLLREKIGGGVCMVDCRSKQKLAWMQERLRMNGFTTFWP
jgi:hypothetical protein